MKHTGATGDRLLLCRLHLPCFLVCGIYQPKYEIASVVCVQCNSMAMVAMAVAMLATHESSPWIYSKHRPVYMAKIVCPSIPVDLMKFAILHHGVKRGQSTKTSCWCTRAWVDGSLTPGFLPPPLSLIRNHLWLRATGALCKPYKVNTRYINHRTTNSKQEA